MSKPEPPSPWFPKVMKNDEYVFLMDATHRGDMYHMRAAMQIAKYSLCLYNCSNDTKDLEDYLKRSVTKSGQHVFLVPWKSDVLYGDTKPKSTVDCTLDGKPLNVMDLEQYKKKIFSENKATFEVKNAAKNGLPLSILNGMAILEPSSKRDLENKFATLFKDVWDVKKPTILGMYRKTGTVVQDGKPPGVYPELDTGNALKEISNILPDKKVRIVSCGNKERLDGIPDDIGEYWLKFKDVKLDPKDSRRDAEAYFLKWAFEKKYYNMATGFRSGPLDLFTFLGIPTVSIGLCYMKGESRHARLATGPLKRVNIQYNRPRHDATAYFKAKTTMPLQFASPFWLEAPPDDAKRNIPADKKTEQEKSPGDFATFDKTILKIGYGVACEKYMGIAKSIELVKPKILDVINSRVARYGYPANLSGNDIITHFQAQRQDDWNDLMAIKNNLIHYQLTPTTFGEKYETPWKDDWEEIYTELGL